MTTVDITETNLLEIQHQLIGALANALRDRAANDVPDKTARAAAEELAEFENRFARIENRLAAIEARLMRLQTIGTWLFAGLLASCAAILAVALKH